MKRQSRISVHAHVGGDHYYMTFLYAGLLRLQKSGMIDLNFDYPSFRSKNYRTDNLIFSLDLLTSDKKIRLCFDLSDSHQHFSCDALATHDLYFKRSYLLESCAVLPDGLRSKLLPFGLVFPCNYSQTTLAIHNLCTSVLEPSIDRQSIKHKIGQFYNYFQTPGLNHYEREGIVDRGSILFQTRAWNPGNYENWQEINDSRRQVIRALRGHFKDRFIGGFVPDTFSRRHYYDSLTDFPSSRKAYVNLMKKSLICVYTRGLFDSPAFKLGEYLATGRCMVAEPLNNQLPEPLQEGVHYLPFTTAEQCVAQCIQLDQDRSLVDRMMKNNAVYYHDHVEPSRQIRRAIEMALASS